MDTNFLQDIFRKHSNFSENKISSLNYNGVELLKLEKQRRNIDKNKLLFVSANNFSKLLLNSNLAIENMKKNELDKFGAYFWDRIEYSLKLNLVKIFPKNNLELLKIGDNLKFENIIKFKSIKNEIDEKEKIELLNKIKENLNPLIRGNIAEKLFAKKLETIHFYNEYKNLIFTGEPDGITQDYVYEFKSHKNIYLANKYLESAKLQADIYCLCFNKKTKIIEQYIMSLKKSKQYKFDFNNKLIDKLIEKYF